MRANRDLLAKLEKLHRIRSKEGAVTLSKADIARSLISRALEEDMKEAARQQKLGHVEEVDKFEESWTQSILRSNVTDYFASTEEQ